MNEYVADELTTIRRPCSVKEDTSCIRVDQCRSCMECNSCDTEEDIQTLVALRRGVSGGRSQQHRRCASLVTASVLLMGKASASTSATASSAPATGVTLSPMSHLALVEHRRRPNQRIHRREAFAAAELPRRARPRRLDGSDSGRYWRIDQVSLQKLERYGERFRGERRTRRGCMMVSAGASGEASYPGEFLQPDDPWSLRAQRRLGGSGSSKPSWPKSVSHGTKGLEGMQESGGARERALRRAANFITDIASSDEALGSWTPRREGQGSWDKTKAKAAELAAPVWLVDIRRGVCTGDIAMSQPIGLDLAECNGGVCVAKVHAGGTAERQGVREGDRIVATSATVGNGLWEKTTIDGISSAVGTRLVFTNTVTFRIERPLEPHQLANVSFKDTVTQTLEVTLKKPPGLILEQVTDPSGSGEPVGVFVAGIVPGSPADLIGEVECGDRVVAVTGSLGNQMWPHRRLEGVESAIDTRIGTTITIRLERAAKMGSWDNVLPAGSMQVMEAVEQNHDHSAQASSSAVTALERTVYPVDATESTAAAGATRSFVDGDVVSIEAGKTTAASTTATMTVEQDAERARAATLEKCSTLVRSYGVRRQAIAVEKLMEHMARSGVQLSAQFLNHAMSAFLMCKEPQKAVDTFYAVTGIVWPELPPWPTPQNLETRGRARRMSEKRRRKMERHTQEGVEAPKSVPMPKRVSIRSGARLDGADAADIPAEFVALKAGPVARDDETEPLDVSPKEHGTMAGEWFLQMREVAVHGAAVGEGAIETLGSAVAGNAVAGAGETGVNGKTAPALGPYVGSCRPNVLLVATVVKAHGRRRRLDDACRTVLCMEDWGLRPDTAVFNSLASAAVWNGRLDLAVQVVLGGMMQEWGVEPDQLSYNTIMDAYARAGNTNNVGKVFNFMVAEGIAPDLITTTTLVKAQVNSGDMTGALETLIAMLRTPRIREKMDAFPFNTIIQGMVKTNLWERAMDVYRSMLFYSIKPDLLTFNSLISGLVRANKPDLAVEMMEDMEASGVSPDVYTFSSFASAYAKLGDVASAVKTISVMSKAGIKPNRFTCSSVMQACVQGGRPEIALQVYEKLVTKGGIKSDEVIDTLLVQANAKLQKFNKALEIVMAMGRNGRDDKVPYNHLLNECVLAGDWDKGTEVLRRMVNEGKGGKGTRFDSNTFRALSQIPLDYDGTQGKSWARLRFLMAAKELVLERGWAYSSTLYLALLEECVSREDYDMGFMIMEDLKARKVFVRKQDWDAVEWIEDKISLKIEQRAIEAFVRRR